MKEGELKAWVSGFIAFMIQRYGANEDLAVWHGSIVDVFLREFLTAEGYKIIKTKKKKEKTDVSELV